MGNLRTALTGSSADTEYRSTLNLTTKGLESLVELDVYNIRTDLTITAEDSQGHIITEGRNALQMKRTSMNLEFVSIEKSVNSFLFYSRFFNVAFEEAYLWQMLASASSDQINDAHLSNVYTAIRNLQAKLTDFLDSASGSGNINTWKDLQRFLEGLSEYSDLKSILNGIFTEDKLKTIADKYYLRKDKDDVVQASAHTKFIDGIYIGPQFLSTSTATGEGGCFVSWVDETTGERLTKIVTDYMEVRKKATFSELEIAKITSVGGQIILSPASMTISKIEDHEYTEEEIAEKKITLSSAGHIVFRCYFETKDEDGNEIHNEFQTGDQARCQTFNGSHFKDGMNHNVPNRYYWRVVTYSGTNYIDLSRQETYYDTGSDAPAVGDKVVLCGSRTEPTRQSVQILSAYGSGSPSHTMYTGVNDFVLEDHVMYSLSYDNEDKIMKQRTYGDWFVGAKDNSTYVKYDSSKKALYLKGVLIQSAADNTKVSPVQCFRGTYDENENYRYGDVVVYTNDGVTSTYICTSKTTITGIPPTNEDYWQVTAKGSKGGSGTSTVTVDLSNEMQGIALDKNGKTTKVETVNTKVSVFYGVIKVPKANYSYQIQNLPSGWTASYAAGSDDITINIPANTQVASSNNISIVVKFTYAPYITEERSDTVNLCVTGISAGADGKSPTLYSMEFNETEIIHDGNAGQWSPTTLTVTKYKKVGDGNYNTTTDGIIYYTVYNGGDEKTSESMSSGKTTGDLPVTASFFPFTKIVFIYKVNDIQQDRETIYKVQHGNDADDPVASYKSIVFKRDDSETVAAPPAKVTDWEKVPDGWSDGIPAETATAHKIWMTSRKVTEDMQEADPAWSTPRVLSSTSDEEYLYNNRTTSVVAPTKSSPSSELPQTDRNNGWFNSEETSYVPTVHPAIYDVVWKRGELESPTVNFVDDLGAPIEGEYFDFEFTFSDDWSLVQDAEYYDDKEVELNINEGVTVVYSDLASNGTLTYTHVEPVGGITDMYLYWNLFEDLNLSSHTCTCTITAYKKVGKDLTQTVWMARRKIKDGSYSGNWEVFKIKGEKGTNGTNGTDSIMADATNQMDGFCVGSDGIYEGEDITLGTDIYLTKGIDKIDVTSIRLTTESQALLETYKNDYKIISGYSTSLDSTESKKKGVFSLTATLSVNNHEFPEKTDINIIVASGSIERTVTYTLTALRHGEDGTVFKVYPYYIHTYQSGTQEERPVTSLTYNSEDDSWSIPSFKIQLRKYNGTSYSVCEDSNYYLQYYTANGYAGGVNAAYLSQFECVPNLNHAEGSVASERRIYFKSDFTVVLQYNVSGEIYNDLDMETIPTLFKGSTGESALTVDLDDEMTGVMVNNDGTYGTTAVLDLSTTARMYFGTMQQTITSMSVSADSEFAEKFDITAVASTGKITIKSNGYLLASDVFPEKIEFTVVATCARGSRTTVYTLMGVRGGEPGSYYKIEPSASVISCDVNSSGYSTDEGNGACYPKQLTCKVYKYKAGASPVEATEGTLLYTLDEGETYPSGPYVYSTYIGSSAISPRPAWTPTKTGGTSWKFLKRVVFEYKINGYTVDKETVPLICSGQNGSGTSAFQIDTDNDMSSFFVGGDGVYSGNVQTFSTNIYLYYGLNKAVISSAVFDTETLQNIATWKSKGFFTTSESPALSISSDGLKCTLSVPVHASAQSTPDSFNFTAVITGSKDGKSGERSVTFKVIPIRAGEDGLSYSIVVTNSAVSYNPNTGAYSPSTVGVSVTKSSGKNISKVGTLSDERLEMIAKAVNDSTEYSWQGSSFPTFVAESTGTVSALKFHTDLTLSLYYQLSTGEWILIDSETVPIIKGGTNGAGSTPGDSSVIVYRNADSQPDTPAAGSTANPPSGWRTDPSFSGGYIDGCFSAKPSEVSSNTLRGFSVLRNQSATWTPASGTPYTATDWIGIPGKRYTASGTTVETAVDEDEKNSYRYLRIRIKAAKANSILKLWITKSANTNSSHPDSIYIPGSFSGAVNGTLTLDAVPGASSVSTAVLNAGGKDVVFTATVPDLKYHDIYIAFYKNSGKALNKDIVYVRVTGESQTDTLWQASPKIWSCDGIKSGATGNIAWNTPVLYSSDISMPSETYMGEYSSAYVGYVGNSQFRHIVYMIDSEKVKTYYRAFITAGYIPQGKAPNSIAGAQYWEQLTTYSALAVDTLFAEKALLENATVTKLKTSSDGDHIEILDDEVRMYGEDGSEKLRIHGGQLSTVETGNVNIPNTITGSYISLGSKSFIAQYSSIEDEAIKACTNDFTVNNNSNYVVVNSSKILLEIDKNNEESYNVTTEFSVTVKIAVMKKVENVYVKEYETSVISHKDSITFSSTQSIELTLPKASCHLYTGNIYQLWYLISVTDSRSDKYAKENISYIFYSMNPPVYAGVIQYTTNRTEIASNGFRAQVSTDGKFQVESTVSDGTQITAKSGNYGIQINNNGLKGTVDGSHYSSLMPVYYAGKIDCKASPMPTIDSIYSRDGNTASIYSGGTSYDNGRYQLQFTDILPSNALVFISGVLSSYPSGTSRSPAAHSYYITGKYLYITADNCNSNAWKGSYLTVLIIAPPNF